MEATTLTTFQIVVIDDEKDTADSMAMILRMLGHEVTARYSAIGALLAAKEICPHFILLDIGLPRMNGFEVAKRLRQQNCEAVIIALSGFGQDADENLAYEAGIDHYLVKPVELFDIQALFEGDTDGIG